MNQTSLPKDSVLIDTDVFSWITWQRDENRYMQYYQLLQGHAWALSFVTVGELHAGALKAKWGSKRIQALEQAIRQCTIIPGDAKVGRLWASLQAKFRDQIGGNDLWIAACALTCDPIMPIATGNLKHFRPVSDSFDIPLIHPSLS